MPIQFKELSYRYTDSASLPIPALDHINLEIKEGKMTAIVGPTGSGKSTLVQHLNALLLPSEGSVTIGERTISAQEKPTHLKALRKQVGLVFQFPEYQLFEETILKDIAFGPKNFGATEEEANQKALAAMKLVNLDPVLADRSPLDLSGGQKRRVAIAGILAMEPEVLVLDEPTASLDPQGAKQMMTLFREINRKMNKTVLIVTHDMEHVFDYCDEVVVINQGKLCCATGVDEFFENEELLKELNIVPPSLIRFKQMLKEKGVDVSGQDKNIDELAKKISKWVKQHG